MEWNRAVLGAAGQPPPATTAHEVSWVAPADARWSNRPRASSGAEVSNEKDMHDPIELELLVRHIGKAKGIELVRLSRIPGAPGVAPAALDALAAAVEGFPGRYGEPSEARRALEDLRERFPN
jgi:hypothetical protein